MKSQFSGSNPQLVRMNPFAPKGDDSDVWELRNAEDGRSQVCVPRGGLELLLELQELKLKRAGKYKFNLGKLVGGEARIDAPKVHSGQDRYLARIPHRSEPKRLLAALRANLILGEAFEAPGFSELELEAGFEFNIPSYVGLVTAGSAGSSRVWMTDHRFTHLAPLTSHQQFKQAVNLSRVALGSYLPRDMRGLAAPVHVDDGGRNFLLEKVAQEGSSTSIMAVDAQGDPRILGGFNPEDILS